MNNLKKNVLLFFIYATVIIPGMLNAMNSALLFGKRGSKLGLFWYKQKPFCAIKIHNDTNNPWPENSTERKFFDRYRKEVSDVNERHSYAYSRKLIKVLLNPLYDAHWMRQSQRDLLVQWHIVQAATQPLVTARVLPTTRNEMPVNTEEQEYSAYCFLQHSATLHYFNNHMIATCNNVGDFYGVSQVDSSLLKKWIRPQNEIYLRNQIEKYIKQICDTPSENVIIKNGY
jgi:hypothetical protein